jgi:uncharacterized protein (DUF1800 family)
MQKIALPKIIIAIVSVTICIIFSSFKLSDAGTEHFSLPYKVAGLSEREAAAHLLSRFTFGAKPGEVDEVLKQGINNWFLQQLNGDGPDVAVAQRLEDYNLLSLTNKEVITNFPRPAKILKMAVEDGVIDKDSVNKGDKKEYREKLRAYMQQKGLKPQQELYRQFSNQKVIRAAYSDNQLREVLTDFWFNHFNVSLTKNNTAEFIPAYERDVIRPNVFGKFEDLLLQTAKSPAMLTFLDNFSSSGAAEDKAPVNDKVRQRVVQRLQMQMGDSTANNLLTKVKARKKAQGLNENYAREVMELHTLGVDGGYSQQDVTNAAKVLTGWTLYPMGE